MSLQPPPESQEGILSKDRFSKADSGFGSAPSTLNRDGTLKNSTPQKYDIEAHLQDPEKIPRSFKRPLRIDSLPTYRSRPKAIDSLIKTKLENIQTREDEESYLNSEDSIALHSVGAQTDDLNYSTFSASSAQKVKEKSLKQLEFVEEALLSVMEERRKMDELSSQPSRVNEETQEALELTIRQLEAESKRVETLEADLQNLQLNYDKSIEDYEGRIGKLNKFVSDLQNEQHDLFIVLKQMRIAIGDLKGENNELKALNQMFADQLKKITEQSISNYEASHSHDRMGGSPKIEDSSNISSLSSPQDTSPQGLLEEHNLTGTTSFFQSKGTEYSKLLNSLNNASKDIEELQNDLSNLQKKYNSSIEREKYLEREYEEVVTKNHQLQEKVDFMEENMKVEELLALENEKALKESYDDLVKKHEDLLTRFDASEVTRDKQNKELQELELNFLNMENYCNEIGKRNEDLIIKLRDFDEVESRLIELEALKVANSIEKGQLLQEDERRQSKILKHAEEIASTLGDETSLLEVINSVLTRMVGTLNNVDRDELYHKFQVLKDLTSKLDTLHQNVANLFLTIIERQSNDFEERIKRRSLVSVSANVSKKNGFP